MRVTRVFALVLAGLLLPVFVLAQAKTPGKTGKTRLERPNWLPAPAPGRNKPPATCSPSSRTASSSSSWRGPNPLRRIRGITRPSLPMVGCSPSARTPESASSWSTWTDPGLQPSFCPAPQPILEKIFQPGWHETRPSRSDTRIDIIAPQTGRAPYPNTSSPAPHQGPDAARLHRRRLGLVVQDLHHVTWYGLDGRIPPAEPLGTSPTIPGVLRRSILPIRPTPICSLSPARPAAPPTARLATLGPRRRSASSSYIWPVAPATADAEHHRRRHGAWTPDGRRIYFAGLPEAPAQRDPQDLPHQRRRHGPDRHRRRTLRPASGRGRSEACFRRPGA